MKEKKWTPGPWVISLANQQGVYDSGVSNEDMHICDICDDGGASGYSEANANLIKAAPDLVEALDQLRVWALDNHTVPTDIVADVEYALAKAYGEHHD